MKQQYAVTNYVPKLNRDYLTSNKEYPILNNCINWADNKIRAYSSFEILDDEGDKLYCLVENCGHIGGNQWTIIEK